MHILAVDDEPSVREALERVLRHDGFEVALAGDGVQAVRQVSAEAPDAVVFARLARR